MKAWLSGNAPGRADLSFGDREPPRPTPGEVAIEVHASALNFSDLLMIDDAYQVRPPRPFIVGQEVAGTVAEAPAGSPWRVGDRVASKVTWGGFAERVAVPADMPIGLPDGMDLATAAAVPVSYTTAFVALTECVHVKAGDTVLVHAAAGGVGLASVQIASSLGANVIATAGSAEKLDLARAHGAAQGVNYRETDWVHEVRELTGGGANVIVDPVGGEIGEQSLRCLAYEGTLLIVGFASGIIPKLATNRLLLKRAAAKGVYWNHDKDAAMLRRVTERLGQALGNNVVRPVADIREGLEALPRALDDLRQRRTRGKIVLRVRNEKGAL